MSQARWKVVATYRSENGPVDIQHDIEELDELADLIERGPDWGAIEDIRITLSRTPYLTDLTLEDAERLGQMRGDEIDAFLSGKKK